MNGNINAKNEIINTIKLLIYKENPSLLENVDFEDDNVFLEPLLYSYFNSKMEYLFSSDILEQIMQGYFIEKKETKINLCYNRNGIAYVPNLGYFKKGDITLYEHILKIGEFEIIKELHPTQERFFKETYRGEVLNSRPIHNSVWKDNYMELFKAIEIIKQYLPEFYDELLFANKGIYLHDNSKILNFTSVKTLGMLFFYVLGKNNLIYYIEELIHQGSHNFFYFVIHHRKDYFRIDVDNLIMRNYTKQEWDYRSIYGAFHGLYTVTKRVEYFDILLSNNAFSGREKHELLGRLADQFSRFRTGLELLNFDEVFTEKGKELYFKYDSKCLNILKKYQALLSFFDLTNRDLDFRYNDFCKLNPIDSFYKKEVEGFFNF